MGGGVGGFIEMGRLFNLELMMISVIHKELEYKVDKLNPFAPEPPVTAHADPGPFYPLWRHQF